MFVVQEGIVYTTKGYGHPKPGQHFINHNSEVNTMYKQTIKKVAGLIIIKTYRKMFDGSWLLWNIETTLNPKG